MKARFNNQDDALFPNQFVNARMLVDTEQNAVVIPTAALQMGNEGHFVWVLNSENKVSKHRDAGHSGQSESGDSRRYFCGRPRGDRRH